MAARSPRIHQPLLPPQPASQPQCRSSNNHRLHLSLPYLSPNPTNVPNRISYTSFANASNCPPSPSSPLKKHACAACIAASATPAVAYLPLRDATAIHKCKVLAGVRWSSEPPKDGGFRYKEAGGEHGYIKIACEDFKEPAMNLKWASDALDRLVAEANVRVLCSPAREGC